MHLPRNALALVLAPVAVGWAATCPAQKRLFLKDVEIGEHWYGAKVGLDDLEGKVVLFAYWGASPGCRELVPHLLRASQDLADRPIHIILTYVEDRPKQQTVAYFAGLGLQQDCPNITLTNDGKHPQVKSKSYVPYYMVFDHRGRLVHHHMGGEYHSGDKRQMIEWLQKLSADVPDFYFGTQPFLKIAPLVERATEKKKLAGAIREAEAMLAPPADQPKPDPATKAELQRLLTVIARYRDRKLKSIELIYPSQPTKVLPMLAGLQREFRGTQLGKAVAAEFKRQRNSPQLKCAVAVHKDYRKIVDKLGKISSCKYCRKEGRKNLRPGCFDCHTVARKAIVKKEVQKLRRLHEDAQGLTIAKEIEQTIELYTSPIVEVNRRR
ncbi:MAG: TlpA family protein disulfide reductase [Planctomycetota bacterium]|jgi:hypothetical protein